MPPHQQVELLVGAANFQVAFQGHRVVALHQRVQELMHADGLPGFEALAEVVSLHHAGHVVLGSQRNHAARAQRVAPFTVVANFGFGRVQHPAGLLVIRFGIGLNLLLRERWPRGVAARRVTDQCGEIANQKDHGVTQILQLTHFVEHHRVPQVDVWRRRVQPQFDAQRHATGHAAGQFLRPFMCRNQFFAAPQ